MQSIHFFTQINNILHTNKADSLDFKGENMAVRLMKVSREFNIGVSTIVEFLGKKGYDISSDPNTKLSDELVDLLEKEFQGEAVVKPKKTAVKAAKPQAVEEADEEKPKSDEKKRKNRKKHKSM